MRKRYKVRDVTWTNRSWNCEEREGEEGRGDDVIFSMMLRFTFLEQIIRITAANFLKKLFVPIVFLCVLDLEGQSHENIIFFVVLKESAN